MMIHPGFVAPSPPAAPSQTTEFPPPPPPPANDNADNGTKPKLTNNRLREMVLRWLPVSDNRALPAGEAPALGDSPVRAVIRSKGFMWMASSHATAYYWSHAGARGWW